MNFQIRHFLDFTPEGPLCHILSAMYQFKNEQGWRRFDLSSPSRKEANLEMCQKVEEALEKKKYHISPKFFLRKNLDKEDVSKIKELAKKRGASIVESEENATHILYPSSDMSDDMFCRGVFKRGDKCLVHFYRMPESHDNWGQVRQSLIFLLMTFFRNDVSMSNVNNVICNYFFCNGRW